MIRYIALLSVFAVSALSFQDSEPNAIHGLDHASGTYRISEVTVTVDEELENSAHLQNLMHRAVKSSVHAFNKATYGKQSVPLKIHLSNINFRDPDAALVSDQATFIEYTAMLGNGENETYQIILPISQTYVAPTRIFNADVKEDITRNMIRTSLKKNLGKLYGLESLPESVQTHFNTRNIFAFQEVSESRL